MNKSTNDELRVNARDATIDDGLCVGHAISNEEGLTEGFGKGYGGNSYTDAGHTGVIFFILHMCAMASS